MSSSKCVICDTPCNINKYSICEKCYKQILTFKKQLSNKEKMYQKFLNQECTNYCNYLLHPNYTIEHCYTKNQIIIASQWVYALLLIEQEQNTDPNKNLISSAISWAETGKKTLKQAIQQNERKKQIEYVNEITEKVSDDFTDYRTQYPLTYRCSDGHFVRSKAEREIDNFLFTHDITHVYEYHYLAAEGKEYFPDFYIPKYNLIIEYFGLNKENYLKTKSEKIETYSEDKRYNFEYLTPDHDSDLEFYLTKIFKKYQY